MAKAFAVCLRTTGMILGWLTLLIALAFALSAFPILCLTLVWL